jgi:hypothetical protein
MGTAMFKWFVAGFRVTDWAYVGVFRILALA